MSSIAMPHSRRDWLIRAAQLSAMGTLPRWAWAQTPRLQHNPFSLGVASGDPAPDGFVLWTRLLPGPNQRAEDAFAGPQTVRWQIADDDGFRRIAAQGTATADPAFAHAVHVEAKGLAPDRWYFYRFMLGDAVSTTGRARTAPAPTTLPAKLRVAYASCQRWEHGFYSAWRQAALDQPDLVLFLGDYMYEYASPTHPKDTKDLARVHTLHYPRTLADYRDRYALHKSDPHLQTAHAAAPWVVTWDDHEVQNDYTASAGKDGRTPDFLLSRTAAWQAYYEHMPLRTSAIAARDDFHSLQLYRRIQWGRLANLHMLDARQYRDVQACRKPGSTSAGAVHPDKCAELFDPARSFLGFDQERWLAQGIAADAKQLQPRWSVIAQQTLFTPRHYPSGVQSTDSWDGYPDARQRLIQSIERTPPRNTVFLGGDIHQNYVCSVPSSHHNRAHPVASEFCGTSISSRSGTTQEKVDAIVRVNPQILFANCEARGYGLCDITPTQWRTTLRAVDNPLDPNSAVRELARFVVEDGKPGPQRG